MPPWTVWVEFLQIGLSEDHEIVHSYQIFWKLVNSLQSYSHELERGLFFTHYVYNLLHVDHDNVWQFPLREL